MTADGAPAALGAREDGVDLDVWLRAARQERQVEERSGDAIHGGGGHRRGLRYLAGFEE